MKILFLTPPSSSEERYGTLAGAGSSTPALGILLLAATARRLGHEVVVIDAAALEIGMKRIMERVRQFQPDVVGISTTTLAVCHAASLADQIKAEMVRTLIVVGGPHISAAAEETMLRFGSFDLAVIGEGEATLVEILSALDDRRTFQDISGICYRDSDGIKITARREFIKDLDTLPFPAWDLLQDFPLRYAPAPFKVKSLPSASLVSSRGCPNQCIFCDRSVFGTGCHAFSVDYVIRMMLELYNKHGIRHICFEDDTFVTFKQRLIELCERLIALKLDLSWSCLGRANHVNAESLALMKQAGCWQISFGIESGSQEILDTIHKNVTLDQIRTAVKLCRDTGILTKGFFIVGHPGETRETLAQTINFALELPLDDISVSMLTPFPGTEIYDRAAEFGQFDGDWSRMNLLNAVFVPFGLSQDDLEVSQRELMRRFYLRPRIVANYLVRLAENPAITKGLLNAALAFIRSVWR
ncbi:MAG: radical SAM protein [Pelobacteraceae bacterium]